MSEQHIELIRMLADAYRPYGWNENSYAGYMIAVGDLDIDLVRRTVVGSLRTETKMPAPAELRRQALKQVSDEAPHADVAWNEVQRAFGTHGRTSTPNWSTPLIPDVVNSIGGWRRLCASTDQVGIRIQFIRTYERLRDRSERDTLISPELAALTMGNPVLKQLNALDEGDMP